MKRLVLLSLLAACGDSADRPDAAVADAGPDAGSSTQRAAVVAGDFTPGSPGVLTVVDVAAGTAMVNVGPAMAVGEDPVLRVAGGELFVVNRASGNNVTILDANDHALVEQLGTGAGTNPQDVAVIGDKLYVATLGNKGMVELTRGTTTITEIDLGVDDPDGKPNCSSVFAVGGELYVACGLLDDTMQFLPPRGPAKVYVVDPTDHTITKTITLSTKNPIALLEQIPMYAPNAGDLVVPTIDFATGAGCVERITTGASAAAAGCIVTNAELGNFASRVGFHAVEFTGPVAPIVIPPRMFLTVPAADFSGSDLRAYGLSDGTLQPDPINTAGSASDVAVCPDGALVVADPTMSAAGVRVFGGGGASALLPVGLRPQSTHGIVCY